MTCRLRPAVVRVTICHQVRLSLFSEQGNETGDSTHGDGKLIRDTVKGEGVCEMEENGESLLFQGRHFFLGFLCALLRVRKIQSAHGV